MTTDVENEWINCPRADKYIVEDKPDYGNEFVAVIIAKTERDELRAKLDAEATAHINTAGTLQTEIEELREKLRDNEALARLGKPELPKTGGDGEAKLSRSGASGGDLTK